MELSRPGTNPGRDEEAEVNVADVRELGRLLTWTSQEGNGPFGAETVCITQRARALPQIRGLRGGPVCELNSVALDTATAAPRRAEIGFLVKMLFYLHARVRESTSGPTAEFLGETSGLPSCGAPVPGQPAVCCYSASASGRGNCRFQSHTRT